MLLFLCTKLFQKRRHYSRGDIIQGGHYLRKYGTLLRMIWTMGSNFMNPEIPGYQKRWIPPPKNLEGRNKFLKMRIWKSINSIYFILNCSEDVRGVDVTQDLNLHPINTVPEYCRLWPALPNACEELMKISNDYSQEWIFTYIQEKSISLKRFQLLFYFWVKCLRRSGSWKS